MEGCNCSIVRKEDFLQKDNKSFLMFRTVIFFKRVVATEGLEPSQTQHLLSRSLTVFRKKAQEVSFFVRRFGESRCELMEKDRHRDRDADENTVSI